MQLSSVGEFPLIDRLSGVLGPAKDGTLVLGIGDDAAAWRPTPGTVTVATADALVEGVHFDLGTTSWEDLGWKALAENVSDVAAMGCAPRYALVTLALPGDTDAADVEALYRGMRKCAEEYGCTVVGGDVVAAPNVVISVTLLGESVPAEGSADAPLLTRAAAKPGDVLAVTGTLGASAAGLRVLQGGAGSPDASPDLAAVRQAHVRPTPRVTAGKVLIEAGVRCAIDVSDGLLADVDHICERSGVDAEIEVERVPIDGAARRLFPDEALLFALTGGEDYELVCAGPAAAIEHAAAVLRGAGETELTIIGRIVAQQAETPAIRVLDGTGAPLSVADAGYKHFTANGTAVHD
jgi:thiamine-monophosphate kinase